MRRFGFAFALALVGCSDPDQPAFTDVQLDSSNKTGFQFQTPVFDIAQGEEVQDCYFTTMPDLNNGQDYWVDHIRVGTNPGSHHMNVFRVKTIVNLGTAADGNYVHGVNGMGECFKSGNWADWPLVVNSQISDAKNPYLDWHMPSGVAQRFSPGERIMVQTHYVNASTQTTPYKGKVVVDMYRSSLTSPIEMGTLFATEQSIRVCRSNPAPTYHGTCAFKTGNVTIAAANGHFHSRGREFDVFKWDGVSSTEPAASDMFYQSLNWADPPMKIYNDATGMQIPPNGGIWWDCKYQWYEPDAAAGGCAAVDARDKQMANDCCYTFGPIVETSEHCNVFVYYYPKVANTSDITCF
jgi:hypothetical protein